MWPLFLAEEHLKTWHVILKPLFPWQKLKNENRTEENGENATGEMTNGEKTNGEKTNGEKTNGEKTNGEKTNGEKMNDEMSNGVTQEESPHPVQKSAEQNLTDIEEAIPNTTNDQIIIDRVLDKTR